MKYLGVDYGSKHIGLSVSDSGGSIAMPKQIVDNNEQAKTIILSCIESEGIEKIVVGKSIDYDGNPNDIQHDIDMFVVWLQETTDLEVVLVNELFTSKQAKWGTEHLLRFNPRNSDRRPLHKKERRIDDKAATLLLQGYLDSHADN